MVSPARALIGILAAACVAGGCSTPEGHQRWESHFDSDVWGGALGAQVERPDRLIPEATLLALILPAAYYDQDIHEHYEEHPLTDDPTQLGANSLQVILPALPTLIGGMKWAGGDGGQNFEVVAETLGGVVAIQQLFARVLVHRERPDHQDDTSFPSGHSSWAFAATSLLVNDMHDPSDEEFHAIDALIYAPAVFNAWERVAIDHHWASDVVCGAFLGVFWANLVWDVHYKGDQEDRATVFPRERRREAAWHPAVDVIDGNLALGFGVSF